METPSETALVPVIAAPVGRTEALIDHLVRTQHATRDALVRPWLYTLDTKATRDAYSFAVKQLATWLEERVGANVDLLDITDTAIYGWRAHLIDCTKIASGPGKLSVASVSQKLSGVRNFYAYLKRSDLIEVDPAVSVKPPKVPDIGKTSGVSVANTGKLLSAAAEASPRDYAFVMFLIGTAVRVSEAINLNLESLTTYHDPADGRDYIRVLVTRKGPREEWVTVPSDVCEAIAAMAEAEGRTDGPMFVSSRSGTRLDRTAAWRILKKLGVTQAGLDKMHPHMLRVAAITTALAQPGAQLHHVQDWAGHRSPATTRRYDREANSARRAPGHALAPLFLAAKASADRAKKREQEEEDAAMLDFTAGKGGSIADG